MSNFPPERASRPGNWLTVYYLSRAGVAALWVAAALTLAPAMPALAAILLVAYPAWDALANFVDAQRSGGLARNRSQAINIAVSTVTAIAIAAALPSGMNAVLAVFGIWAVLAGLLQLAAAVARWKTQGGQWAMILSGAQSALAGAYFVSRALAPDVPGILDFAPYAALGAFYFLISAIWLIVSGRRKQRRPVAEY